jgi:hypothetical protein
MGRDIDRAKEVLAVTDRRSIQLIARDDFPRFTSASKTTADNEFRFRNVSKPTADNDFRFTTASKPTTDNEFPRFHSTMKPTADNDFPRFRSSPTTTTTKAPKPAKRKAAPTKIGAAMVMSGAGVSDP